MRCMDLRWDGLHPFATLHPKGGPHEFRQIPPCDRSDFDGLVCAVLLNELNLIDDILFVHPQDIRDGKIAITNRDITTNLPYVAAGLAFDHHGPKPSATRASAPTHHLGPCPSAARVVYDYYGGAKTFPRISQDMMAAVDKADSAQFSHEEILEPTDWVLLNYLMDSRTGLGRFREFRVSNYQLMMDLIKYCPTTASTTSCFPTWWNAWTCTSTRPHAPAKAD